MSAKGMGINNSTQLESRNPLPRVGGSTSENKDIPPKTRVEKMITSKFLKHHS